MKQIKSKYSQDQSVKEDNKLLEITRLKNNINVLFEHLKIIGSHPIQQSEIDMIVRLNKLEVQQAKQDMLKEIDVVKDRAFATIDVSFIEKKNIVMTKADVEQLVLDMEEYLKSSLKEKK